MKIGVMLAGVNTKFWTAAAQAAEEAGFESVWLPEHLVFPVEMKGSPHAGDAHPPIPSNTPAFDALMALAAIAATTKNVRLGTNVYNIGLRHPFVTARAITTLDVISGGRVEFGIGASWLEEEWDATGLDFHTRGRRVDETIDICRRLWSEDVVEHHGEFFDFAPVMFNPKPVQQPQPSLLIGGDGAAAKRRAALVGDGWLPMNHSLEQLPGALAEINAQRAKAGRDGTTTLTVGGGIESRADVDRYRAADVDRVLVRPFMTSKEALDGIASLRRRDHRQARRLIRSTLLALEIGRALLGEGLRPFLGVVAGEHGLAVVELVRQRLRFGHAVGLAEGAEDRLDRERAVVVDLLRDLLGLGRAPHRREPRVRSGRYVPPRRRGGAWR